MKTMPEDATNSREFYICCVYDKILYLLLCLKEKKFYRVLSPSIARSLSLSLPLSLSLSLSLTLSLFLLSFSHTNMSFDDTLCNESEFRER